MKEIPIILTAFGTTAKAFATYEKMDKVFKKNLSGHQIHWAYSSRMVKHAMKRDKNLDLKDPVEMAQTLAEQGHQWVVMQSLHLTCGHEFDRLVAERDQVNIRSSIGLPLLTSYSDYEKTAAAIKQVIPEEEDQAVVLVGHGSDHPSWSAYPAFETVLRQKYGKKMFVGVVEYSPGMDYILERIKLAGFKKACLIPLLLVAGFHFKKDFTGRENSWQKTFERNSIKVSIVDHGVGEINAVTKIFCDHITDALNVIPL
jgi:sirohydrochlorin cobaltochelatase